MRVYILCLILLFLWHLHNDVATVQRALGILDDNGKVLEQFRDKRVWHLRSDLIGE